MALKNNRSLIETDVTYFMTSIAQGGERGGFVSAETVGSGAAMDQSAAVCEYRIVPSGAQVLGVLLNGVVNIDQTRQHINQHKDEMQVGNKVAIAKQGWVVTDMIIGTPLLNETAYLAASGNVSGATDTNETASQGLFAPAVGRFLSTKDQNGYAKVEINIDTGLPAPAIHVDGTTTV